MGAVGNWITFGLLMPIGLLGPGWLPGKALRADAGIAGSFLASSAFLLNLVLLLDAAGLAIDRKNLACGLALICLSLLLVMRKRRSSEEVRLVVTNRREPAQLWLLLPATLGLTAILAKSLFDPLSGLDTRFRWDFLGQQILNEETLNFYPAVSALDFTKYAWCDGIVPLISSLYLWTYLSWGEVYRLATAPVVILQACLILYCPLYDLYAPPFLSARPSETIPAAVNPQSTSGKP